MATNETDTQSAKPAAPTAKTEAVTSAKYEPGFRADKSAYPGVDPDTGERKAVTWDGLREEFGEREGARLYNDIAVAAFGGVQPGRPSLSYITALDEKFFRSRRKDQSGRFTESEEEHAKALEKFRARGKQIKNLMADAVAAKGV